MSFLTVTQLMFVFLSLAWKRKQQLDQSRQHMTKSRNALNFDTITGEAELLLLSVCEVLIR